MREEELKLEKIKKSCNITEKVGCVLEIILFIVAFVCVVSGIALIKYAGQINSETSMMVSQSGNDIASAFSVFDEASFGGILKMTFKTDKMLAAGEYGQVAAIYCFFGALILGVVAAIFDLLRRVFKTIKVSETPFDEEVLKKLKKFFIAITTVVLIMSGLGEGLFCGLICWSIYNILDYGFTIQKQVDETL